jgi:D-aspartate ligase
MKPAIVLSGHTMALGVVRALSIMGVPVTMVHYDERDMGHVSKYITYKIEAPHPEKKPSEFVEILLDCGRRYKGGVLFPVSDETVVIVSKHKQLLEEYFIVSCPQWEITRQFIEKKLTYAVAEASGVPAPKTIVPRSLADVNSYTRKIDFPCLVKPSQSHLFYDHFGRKMFPVDNAEQLIAVYQQATFSGLEVMLQEIIPGADTSVVNYNAYHWNGDPLIEFTAEHIRNAPPSWGSPRVAFSKAIPEVVESGRKILQAMGYHGYACTEFKKDSRDGIYKLMEVNGRHNLSTLLAVRCGINFPWLQYQHLAYGKVPANQKEFKQHIYWIDIPRDVGYSIKYLKQERYSPLQYLRPYLNSHVFAILDWKDPRPFIKRCTFLIKQSVGLLLKRFGLTDAGISVDPE